MVNFEYYTPTKVVFGKDSEKKTGELLKEYGATKVLIHYGGNSARKSGLLDRICTSLAETGIPYVTLGGVVPNPRISLARQGIELCKKENVDFLLAVGGGSVIDSCKAIGHGLYHDCDPWPVSYTHLDVYKRQGQIRMTGITCHLTMKRNALFHPLKSSLIFLTLIQEENHQLALYQKSSLIPTCLSPLQTHFFPDDPSNIGPPRRQINLFFHPQGILFMYHLLLKMYRTGLRIQIRRVLRPLHHLSLIHI